MKGVILAGGNGTRLAPLTELTNKHLLPVFDKQMILYPLQTLIDGGIRDILIITGGNSLGQFVELLGSGVKYGCNFTYKVQDHAGGIAHALLLAEDFIGADEQILDFVVILGDNIFEDRLIFDMPKLFLKSVARGADRFGVVEEGSTRIVEKPKGATFGRVVTGCYVYSSVVFDFIRTLKPSARGELEITDVNNYLMENHFGMGIDKVKGFWSDAGTFESLSVAAKWAEGNRQTAIDNSSGADIITA